ncbi:MAG: hypothetical protein M3Q56_09230 [Bacteroidota bacterium]|nr:hypothetical protein [Bacteroidota bacterium]
MTISYFSYVKTEQRSSVKGFISATCSLLLLLLTIYFIRFPILTEDPFKDQPPYLSLIEFIPEERIKDYDDAALDAGGSKGSPGIEELEGGSKGQEEEIPEPKVDPVVEEKVETKPVEKIPSNSAPKPVLTQAEPDIVKLPTPPPVNIPAKTNPGTGTVPTKVDVPSNTPSTNKPSSSSSGDDDQPGSGGTGTGTGSGTGAGTGNSGSGTGAGGGTGTGGGGGTGGGSGAGTGTGTGDGVGVDFDEEGPLRRKPIYRPDVTGLARPIPQQVVFNMCINRDGVVTYIRYNSKLSKTKDIQFIREATKKMNQYKFQPDQKAPKKECGTFTFTLGGLIQRLN